MRRSVLCPIFAASAVVAGTVVGVDALAGPDPSVSGDRTVGSLHGVPNGPTAASNQMAALRDVSCSMDATPDLSEADPRMVAMAKVNPVAQAVSTRYSREAAVEAARKLSSDPGLASVAPAAAMLAPAAFSQMASDLVSPDRCVWIVTVKAPYQPAKSDPFGQPIAPLQSYTFALDAASGQGLGLNSGSAGINVLTGRVVSE